MKIAYKIALFSAVLLSVSACKLDQNPTSTIPIKKPAETFKSYGSTKSFANGMSVYFRSTLYGKFAITADVQGDLFNATIEFGNRSGAPHTMGASFNANDYDVKEVWDGYYAGIVDYNYFIHNVDYVFDATPAVSSAERKEIQIWKGYAHFYRAYSYFELAKKFCAPYAQSSALTSLGLPILGEFDVNQKPARATLQATMDSIATDLDKAATYLATVKGVIRSETPTIDAVNALKARFYLWTKDYPNAIVAADAVITSPAGYALASTVEQMQAEFHKDNGTEDIMQLYSSITESPSSIGVFFGSPYSDGIHYTLPDFIPTKKLVEMYGTNDTRAKVFIAASPTGVDGNAYELITLIKYRGNQALTTSPTFRKLNKAKVFRVAEMYLIKAEAEVLGGTGDPASTLNALQVARGATPTGGTLVDVQTEWARETVGEGMRIECLKRWDILFTTREPQAATANFVNQGVGFLKDVPVNLNKYTWPIPTNDITFNKNLVQNPGWGV